MVSNLTGQTYQERLSELGMPTLEERRERGDLIQAYKVLTGKEVVFHNTWFTICLGMHIGHKWGVRWGVLQKVIF